MKWNTLGHDKGSMRESPLVRARDGEVWPGQSAPSPTSLPRLDCGTQSWGPGTQDSGVKNFLPQGLSEG